jgi:hypothetical protein
MVDMVGAPLCSGRLFQGIIGAIMPRARIDWRETSPFDPSREIVRDVSESASDPQSVFPVRRLRASHRDEFS